MSRPSRPPVLLVFLHTLWNPLVAHGRQLLPRRLVCESGRPGRRHGRGGPGSGTRFTSAGVRADVRFHCVRQ